MIANAIGCVFNHHIFAILGEVAPANRRLRRDVGCDSRFCRREHLGRGGGTSVAALGDQDASAIVSQNASSEQDNVDVTVASSAESHSEDAASAGSEARALDATNEAANISSDSEKPITDASMANSLRYQNDMFVCGGENTERRRSLSSTVPVPPASGVSL